MKTYLVIDAAQTGIASLDNVGIFQAELPGQAVEAARIQWGYSFSRGIKAYDMEGMYDGWSYYNR